MSIAPYHMPDIGISAEEILFMYDERVWASQAWLLAAKEIRDQYNSDVTVAMPDIDAKARPAIVNLVANGLDQLGMRISSVVPEIMCPPTSNTKTAQRVATEKRSALKATWAANRMPLIMARRARHLIGYATTAAMLWPDMNKDLVRWTILNPLDCYPAPTNNPDDPNPDDVITVRNLPRNHNTSYGFRGDEQLQILTYYGPREVVQLVISLPTGSRNYGSTYSGVGNRIIANTITGSQRAVKEVHRFDNRIDQCIVTMPKRISLDRLMSQFESILGMMNMQAELMAFEIDAIKQNIYPNEWIIENPNSTLEVVTIADGKTGTFGQIKGGNVQTTAIQPNLLTNNAIDRLERNSRVTAGISPDMGGESSTNIRTGRRGQDILSAVVDYPIREAQLVLAEALTVENDVAQKLYKAYWPNKQISMYTPTGKVEFTPKKTFEEIYQQVSYSFAGTDINALIIGAGQRIGLGEMSTESVMEMDPWIEDVAKEKGRIQTEALERAAVSAIQKGAEAGAIAMIDIVWMLTEVKAGRLTLEEASLAADERASQRQASVTPQGAPDTALPGSPAAQPGLQGGASTAVPEAVPGATPSQLNVSQLLNTLRNGSNQPTVRA